MDRLIKRMRPNLASMSPYVPGKPIHEVEREYGLSEVVKLASNENSLGPSPAAQRALSQALGELHRYPDGGSAQLKSALAQHFDLAPNWFLVGNGSDEIIKLISETFLEADDEVIVPAPSFSEYLFGTLLMSARPVTVTLAHAFSYDVEAILAKVTSRTKMVYICNPNNPTGTYMNTTDFERLLDALPDDVVTIIDEAYAEYVTASDYPSGVSYVRQGRPVIVMRTFSKVYGLAGLRVGYAIANPEVIEWINRVREPFNVNSLAQLAACAALADAEHVQRARDMNDEGKKQLYSALKELGLTYIPTEANFILVDVKQPAVPLFEAMLRQGVIARAGFGGLSTWLRITIGTEEENDRLIQALAGVLASASMTQ